MMRLYVFVLVVAVLLLVAGVAINIAQASGLKGAGEFAIGLASNLVAAVIVAALVERVLEDRKRSDERQRRTVALHQLQRRLTQHLNVLFLLRTAASEYSPEFPTFGELLGEEMLEAFKNLDFLRALPPVGTALSYFATDLARLKETLDATVAKYALVLDSETLAVIEKLSQASLVDFITDNERWVRQGRLEDLPNAALLRHPTAESMIRAYIDALRTLVGQYDEVVPEPAKLLAHRPDLTLVTHGAARSKCDMKGVAVANLPPMEPLGD